MKNTGEVDQYYVENSHPAIIKEEILNKTFVIAWNSIINIRNELI